VLSFVCSPTDHVKKVWAEDMYLATAILCNDLFLESSQLCEMDERTEDFGIIYTPERTRYELKVFVFLVVDWYWRLDR